jgi:hypothetical protein
MYLIEAFDTDGCTVTVDSAETIKDAKVRAKYFMSREYVRAIEAEQPDDEMVAKVRVTRNGTCIFDLFR